MSNGLRDRIAKVVLDKILVMFTENDPVESASAYIADAIQAIPGIAVVELPEPHSVTDNTAGWPSRSNWAVSRNVGLVLTEHHGALRPSDARGLAAALLAAADYAERAP